MRPLRPAAGSAAPMSLGELVAAMRDQSSTDREAVAKVVQLIQQGRLGRSRPSRRSEDGQDRALTLAAREDAADGRGP